jgi:hypothetical protein
MANMDKSLESITGLWRRGVGPAICDKINAGRKRFPWRRASRSDVTRRILLAYQMDHGGILRRSFELHLPTVGKGL